MDENSVKLVEKRTLLFAAIRDMDARAERGEIRGMLSAWKGSSYEHNTALAEYVIYLAYRHGLAEEAGELVKANATVDTAYDKCIRMLGALHGGHDSLAKKTADGLKSDHFALCALAVRCPLTATALAGSSDLAVELGIQNDLDAAAAEGITSCMALRDRLGITRYRLAVGIRAAALATMYTPLSSAQRSSCLWVFRASGRECHQRWPELMAYAEAAAGRAPRNKKTSMCMVALLGACRANQWRLLQRLLPQALDTVSPIDVVANCATSLRCLTLLFAEFGAQQCLSCICAAQFSIFGVHKGTLNAAEDATLFIAACVRAPCGSPFASRRSVLRAMPTLARLASLALG